MATSLIDPKTQLDQEAQKIASLGSANPSTPQGAVAYNPKGPSVGSGFGTDTGGRIFRYDGNGNLSGSGASSNPAPASPNVPGATNPDGGAGSGVTRYANSSLSVNATLTPDEYQAQFGAKPVDENAIREEVRRQNQARIDAVNAAYDAMVREQARTNEGNLGSTRAIGARSGLLGSDFGEAQLSNQRQAGTKAIEAINTEREARVTSILAEVNKLGSDEIAAKKLEAQGNANAYKDYLEKAQTKAQNLIINLAKIGAQLDPASEQYKSLLKASGMSELEFDAAYNANKKAADKVKYEYKELKDGTVARFGDDGSYKEIKNAAPVENGYELKELSDGTLVQFNKTTNDVKVYGKQGQFAKPADAKDTNFTLGPGEVRYDANGNVVARGPEKPNSENNPTSYKEWELAGSPGTYASWLKKNTSTAGLNNETISLIQNAPETKKLETLADLKNKLDAYKTAIVDNGFQVTGPKAASLDALYAQLQVAYKDAAGLGALTGPDLDLLSRAIKPSSGLGSIFSYGASGGKEGVTASIDAAMNALKTTAQRQTDQFNAKFGNYQDSPYVQAITAPFSVQEIDRTDPQVKELIDAHYSDDQIRQLLGKTSELSNSEKGSIVSINLNGKKVAISSSIASPLEMADRDFFAATGKHIQVNEAFRSHDRQAELYASYKSGKGGRAAPPGKSFHETGKSVDIANWEEAAPYLKKYGFKNDLADDKNHFSIGEFA